MSPPGVYRAAGFRFLLLRQERMMLDMGRYTWSSGSEEFRLECSYRRFFAAAADGAAIAV